MIKIGIIGSSGFLGTKLRSMMGLEYEVTGTYLTDEKNGLKKVNVTDKKEIDGFLRMNDLDVVIHTVAISDVDRCEMEKKLAERVNYQGTKNVVDVCRDLGVKLIYISTNYVFDGVKGDYSEGDECKPINFYGETKHRAEQEVLRLEDSIILRFDALYGFNGFGEKNGFFGKILDGEELNVNCDQKRQPLFVDDVGYAIQVLLSSNCVGIYHLAGPDRITKHELGLMLERIVRENSLLRPIPEQEQTARRPRNVSLETEKAMKEGIRFHSIDESIDIIRRQIEG